MQTEIFLFLAETFVHPGAGQSDGAIDLPVAREKATDYPYLPGSGLKGALRDAARVRWPDVSAPKEGQQQTSGQEVGSPQDPGPPEGQKEAGEAGAKADAEQQGDSDEKTVPHPTVNAMFGRSDKAGALLVSDLRLLLLPVRCLTASYRWLACPHLLERLHRDLRRATGTAPAWDPPEPLKGSYLGKGDERIQLEERTFTRQGGLESSGLNEAMQTLCPDSLAAGRLPARLAILHDDDFAWFARYGLPVQARNVLEPDTKQSLNLWYEEALPPDTLMYALISSREPAAKASDACTNLKALLAEPGYIQVGGNETVGQGWFRVGSATPGGDSP